MYPSPMSTTHSPYTASTGSTAPTDNTTQPQRSSNTIPSATASAIKRQPNDPILWFANPPMNVPPQLADTPVHSITYLNWKRQQQQ